MSVAEKTYFQILRSSLAGNEMNCSVELDFSEWRELYFIAVSQMTGALVFDTLQKAGSNIPQALLSDWEKDYIFTKKRFDTQLLSLNHLLSVLDSEGITTLVLKGLGFALNYPNPLLRECCDIDIYCFEDYEKVNRLVISSGLCDKAEETEEKHFGFIIDGIEVESHKKFTSEVNNANILIGKSLLEMAKDRAYTDSRVPGILFPSIRMSFLHLIIHTLSHLAWSGITVRHLCDITTFLNKHSTELDLEQMQPLLKEAGIWDSTRILINLCHRLLGSGLNFPEVSAEDKEDFILYSILHPFKLSQEVSDPIRKLDRKIRQYNYRKKMHRLVYGEPFPDSFFDSFAFLHRSDYRG